MNNIFETQQAADRESFQMPTMAILLHDSTTFKSITKGESMHSDVPSILFHYTEFNQSILPLHIISGEGRVVSSASCLFHSAAQVLERALMFSAALSRQFIQHKSIKLSSQSRSWLHRHLQESNY